ncbi:MAG TPA: RtcB family protein [Trebonia sp.]|nr:RtcB family protein [Trebonia sp.]
MDIGCFLGETRVPLLDGRQRTLTDMAEAGGSWWVYSLDASGQVVPGRAVALKTRTDAELMKVTVSGGDEIVCTPDHRFMMVDGTYRQARELRFKDSLMTGRPEHFQAAMAGNGKRGTLVLANNHEVIAVEALAERDDVYCLQVAEHHNFALAAGVFVHNCGMIAVRTRLVRDDLAGRPLARLREAIEKAVPLSAGRYNEAVHDGGTRDRIADLESRDGADSAQAVAPNWRLQVGSLGSGNHFIEVSLDEADRVWLFLHSGSRGVGNKLATRHIKVAQQWCERAWIPLPDPDLAYLVEGTPEFWAYLRDLRWAQHFALLNREEMMARVTACLAGFMGRDVAVAETIQCHHNYTEQMSEDMLRAWKSQPKGRSGHVWLSRKGAIDASPGKPGLIPGSMGTRSYVVTGKGNKLSLNSSPHGAGREYSRSAARKTFTRTQLYAAMEGIEWGRSDAFLDEHPQAYKPVERVMADAADLVKVEHTLRQIVNVKGD